MNRPASDPAPALHDELFSSPIGDLLLSATEAGLRSIRFVDGEDADSPTASPETARRGTRDPSTPSTELLAPAHRWLDDYFAGREPRPEDLELPLDVHGTPFQLRVWKQLIRIPYGHTVSYGQIAKRLRQPGAARAVGLANHRNPIPIIIPCHRVVGADGKLVGYGGGLWRKKALLRLEEGDLFGAR